MKHFLYSFLNQESIKKIHAKHYVQKIRYGVYATPSLNQLISLRHLLIDKGITKEVNPESLLGLTKIECTEILKKFNE